MLSNTLLRVGDSYTDYQVLPTRDVVIDIVAALHAANATGLISVGSGGRLDLERCILDAMQGGSSYFFVNGWKSHTTFLKQVPVGCTKK